MTTQERIAAMKKASSSSSSSSSSGSLSPFSSSTMVPFPELKSTSTSGVFQPHVPNSKPFEDEVLPKTRIHRPPARGFEPAFSAPAFNIDDTFNRTPSPAVSDDSSEHGSDGKNAEMEEIKGVEMKEHGTRAYI